MQEVLHKGGVSLGGWQAQHVHHSNGLHMHHFAVELHALEHAVQHLRQAGLGRGLIDSGAAHQEDIVARPHGQQQSLHTHPETAFGHRHADTGVAWQWQRQWPEAASGQWQMQDNLRQYSSVGVCLGHQTCPWRCRVEDVAAVSKPFSTRSSTPSSGMSSQRQSSSIAWA